MKAKWGKYKASEVDVYLEKLQQDRVNQAAEWNHQLEVLMQENQRLKERLTEAESKEKLIARVMVDATMRAKDIEEGYKQRAYESDTSYGRLRSEWMDNLKGCKSNIDKIRREAANLLLEIDEQFEQVALWSGEKISILEALPLPQLGQSPLPSQNIWEEKRLAEREQTETITESQAETQIPYSSEMQPQKEQDIMAEAAMEIAEPMLDDTPAEITSNTVQEPPAEEREAQRAVCMDLEREIAKGISADLKALCEELGLFDEAQEE